MTLASCILGSAASLEMRLDEMEHKLDASLKTELTLSRYAATMPMVR